MSLGLSDLNKKRRKTESTYSVGSGNASTADASPADASKMKQVYTRSKTARPWSEEATSRAPSRGRPRQDVSDIAVNEEWMELQIQPLIWIDLNQNSYLLKLNDHLAQIEARIQQAVVTPALALRQFFFGQK